MKTAPFRIFLVLVALLIGIGARTAAAQEVIRDEWGIVQIDGVRSGHTHVIQTRIQEDGATLVRTAAEVKIKISRMGAEMETEVESSITETEEGKPVRFTLHMKQAGMPEDVSGVVRDGKMVLTAEQMGVKQETETDLDPETVGLWGWEKQMEEKGLEEGTTYARKVFVPDMKRAVTITAKVGGEGTVDFLGEEMKLYRIDQTIAELPGVTATTWLDKEFEARVEVVNMGLMVQTVYWGVPKEKALAESSGAKLPDLMTKGFIEPDHPMAHPRGIRSATFRLRPKGETMAMPVVDEIQKVIEKMEDGAVVLRIAAVAPEGDTVPFPVEEPDLAAYLEESIYLQCKDEALAAEAKKVVGDEKDSLRAARKLERWVFENIDKKSLDVGFASAKEVFQDRKGDCSEHGVLLAAMARSVGIPSRVAIGIEYVFGIFGWHMWTEVWAGQWVPLDATLASPFVDATHIKFAQSALNEPAFDDSVLAMVGVLGNLEIDVLEYSVDGKTIKPGAPEAKPRIEGRSYTNPLLGVSFEAPEGWKIDVGEGNDLAVIRPADGDSSIVVRAMALSYDNSLKKQIEALKGVPDVTTRDDVTIGGHPGIYVSFPDKRAFATQPSDTLYDFTLTGPTEASEKIFEKFIESVKIEK